MITVEWLEDLGAQIYRHYERFSLMFTIWFLARCVAMLHKCEGVPRVWIIDASWYVYTALGVALAVPPVVIATNWYNKIKEL